MWHRDPQDGFLIRNPKVAVILAIVTSVGCVLLFGSPTGLWLAGLSLLGLLGILLAQRQRRR